MAKSIQIEIEKEGQRDREEREAEKHAYIYWSSLGTCRIVIILFQTKKM